MEIAKGTDIALLMNDESLYRGSFQAYDPEEGNVILKGQKSGNRLGIPLHHVKEVCLDSPPISEDETVEVTFRDTRTDHRVVLTLQMLEDHININTVFNPSITSTNRELYVNLAASFIRRIMELK